jgi:hypothetical protein
MPPLTNSQAVSVDTAGATGSGAPVVIGPFAATGTDAPQTFELWAQAAPDQQTLATVATSDGTLLLTLALTGWPAPAAQVTLGPAGTVAVTSDPLDVDLGWHLYSVSWGPAGVALWIDALPAGTAAASVPLAGPLQLTVGVWAQRVRQARLWTAGLTQTQVEAGIFECEAPQPDLALLADLTTIPARDRSGGGAAIALGDGVQYEIDTMACALPGASWVDCGAPPGLVFAGNADFTLETWVNVAQLDGTMAVASRRDAAGNGWDITVDSAGVSVSRGTDATVTGPLTAGAWTHVASVYDGGSQTLALYVDGNPCASVSATEANALDPASTLWIGAAGATSPPGEDLMGLVGELRVWDCARTHEEIAAYMHAHPLGAPSLRAYYAFDVAPATDLTGQQPEITLAGNAEIMANALYVAPDAPDLGSVLPPPGPRHEPTQEELQAELALLRAALPEGALSGPVDFGRLAELDQSGFVVALEVDGGHLVLRDNRADGAPVLLRAVDEIDDMTVWTIAVVLQSLDVFFTAVGLRLISGRQATSVAMKLLRNTKFRTALATMMAAIGVRSLLGFIVELADAGLLWGIVWDLVDIGFWAALSFVAGIFRWATPTGIVLMTIAMAVSIAGLIYLIANRPSVGAPTTETITIRMFQASYGDCILLGVTYQSRHDVPPETRYVLVDGGPRGVYNTIQHLLPGDLDTVCCTHVDEDHIYGLLELFRAIPVQPPPAGGRRVGQLLFNAPPTPVEESPLAGRRDLVFQVESWRQGYDLGQLAAAKHVAVVPTQAGSAPIGYGTVALTFSGPQAYNIQRYLATQNADNANRESIIFLARSARNPNVSILMTGDACDLEVVDTPPAPPGNWKTDIRGDTPPPATGLHYMFLKVPHHGSDRSSDAHLYAGITADNYLISADDARHTLPTYDALKWIVQGNQAAGLTGYNVYCTNLTPEVTQIANDAQYGPAAADYNLYYLNAGQLSLDFTITNGVITAAPAPPVVVTRL